MKLPLIIWYLCLQKSMESTTTVVRKPGVVEAKLVVKDLFGPNRNELLENMKGYPYICIESEKFLVGDTPMSVKVWLGKMVYARIGLHNYGDPGIRVKGKLVTDVQTMDLDYEGPVKVEGGAGMEHNLFLPWGPLGLQVGKRPKKTWLWRSSL